MRLKRIQIKNYKNLDDCIIDFTKTDGVTILVGNNGSGKSNLLEALSAIFDGLLNSKLIEIPFTFLLVYEKENNSISVNNLTGSLNVTGADSLEALYDTESLLPDKVFAVYSGEDLRLWNQHFFSYYTDFYEGVIGNLKTLDALKLNYLNKYHWNIAIVLLAMKDSELLNAIIPEQSLVDLEVQINATNLERFSQNSPNDVTNFVVALKEKLNNNRISLEEFSNLEYESIPVTGSFIEVYYKLLVACLPKELSFKTIDSFSINFESTIASENQNFSTADLSEGQKKELLITLVTEVLAGNDSIILLDEPDSHINPIRQEQLFEHLKKSDSQNIILTTHSPTLATLVDSKHIAFVEEGKVDQNTEKFSVLKNLTDGKWVLDNISNLLVSSKDILLVEGKTDAEYIDLALEKLKEEDVGKYQTLEFTYIPVGGASGLEGIIPKLTPNVGQKIIALLDRDKAGKESYCKIFEKTENDLSGSDFTQWNSKEYVDITFLPSSNPDCRNFEVEDYFGVEVLKEIATEFISSKSQLKEFDGVKENIKTKLQSQCQGYDPEKFVGFKVLFDHIIQLKNRATIIN